MGFTVQHVAAGDDEVIGVVGKSLQQVVFLNFLQKNMDEGMAVCKILQHGCEMVLGQDGEGADGQPLACFFLEFRTAERRLLSHSWISSSFSSFMMCLDRADWLM